MMVENIQKKIAKFIAPKYIQELEKNDVYVRTEVNRRVAETLSKMDILDILLKDFHGTFSTEYERPEEKLDARGQLGMKMWGYTQAKDPHFKYLTDWVMDQHANEMIRHAAVTPERILYGRAQIASTELLTREVGRLSREYEDMLEKNKVQNFDSTITVE